MEENDFLWFFSVVSKKTKILAKKAFSRAHTHAHIYARTRAYKFLPFADRNRETRATHGLALVSGPMTTTDQLCAKTCFVREKQQVVIKSKAAALLTRLLTKGRAPVVWRGTGADETIIRSARQGAG